ncbi:protein of unknown function [Dyadobacter koreensis]|uniref:DUF4917 domain-containing protein n=1 Tax=Dyadobacter koreensis TaxID=408657 RepID=A0A1H7AZL9_9BACT|nr:DUF4917 family protein [Dyadobacter koreensis]SEJ71033.1 protein of unknown function [Dyadobacter koreensis]
MELMSFDDCLALAKGKKHLLLGNGFSISCRPSIFTYGNLFTQAQPKFNTQLNDAFKVIDTKDFEVVMKSLKNASLLSEIYDKGNSYKNKMTEDSLRLKSILVSTIASSHPTQPNDITEIEFITCRKFLSNFDNKYTLNYDLLLYWTLMHEEPFSSLKIKHDDGFRTPSDGKTDYVTWEINNTNQQTVFYLHGALHLFDAGEELQKFTWVNTGVKLTEQITAALDKDFYPLFVSEGSSSEKREKISHSGYLSRGIRSFANIGGSLFIYGHSLADNDDHITNLIPESKIESIFVSIYGDTTSQANRNIILKAGKLIEDRKAINSKKSKGAALLSVYFYDAASTSIWK